MKLKKTLLITGGSGYLGSNLIEILDQATYEIHAVARSAKNVKEIPGVCWHFYDLLKSNNYQIILEKVKPDLLIHLAWKIGHGLNHDSVEQHKLWLEKSKSLITSFYNLGGEKAIISGTCAEYNWEYNFLTENSTPLTPSSDYGQTKVALYKFVKKFCNQNGFLWSWPRIFFSFGPDQNSDSLVPSAISSLREGKIFNASDGIQKFDYLYVKDVVMAIRLLIERDYIGEINICSGEGTSIKDLLNLIGKSMGHTDLIKFGKRSRPKNAPSLIVGNNSKLLKLGWKPEYSLEQGILLTIKKYED